MSNREETISKEYKKAFMEHLKGKLEEINGNYTYTINWYIDIEKRKTSQDPRVDVQNKEIFIVLTPLPSRSYGEGSIVQQLEITALCNMNDMSDVMDILSEYQDSVVNKKWWTDKGTLVNESWFSPTIQETLFNLQIGKGSMISMQGSVSFTPNVTDIEKVLIFGQWNKIYEFSETTTGDTIPNTILNENIKRSTNRTKMYTINLKCKSSNSTFCQTIKQWKRGKVSLNIAIPVSLIYTDEDEPEVHNMIISSAVFSTADGMIPTWSVQLTEKL